MPPNLLEVDFSLLNYYIPDEHSYEYLCQQMHYWSDLCGGSPFIVFHVDYLGDTLVTHGD